MLMYIVGFVEDSVLAKVVGFVEISDKREVKSFHKPEFLGISFVVEAAGVFSPT